MGNDYWSKNLHMNNLEILDSIKKDSKGLPRDVSFMEVCGGHTNTIMKYGIRKILPENIRLISGPGCPVCVTSQVDIDSIIKLALEGVPVATYGDMLRVPGTTASLEQARAQGAKVYTVYSTAEVIELKEKEPDIIFFGIGFETTAPMSAFLLEHNIPVFSTHKLILPAMKELVKENCNIDGFILPGHVSVITGTEDFKSLDFPQAVCGFEPEHMLRGIYALVKAINNNSNVLANTYPEAVRSVGNEKAKALINKHFVISSSSWRGLGEISASGYEVKNDSLNAREIYKTLLKDVYSKENKACRCGEVLKGLIRPNECTLFGKKCVPENPKGACMVSSEGACHIYFNYLKR
ncbi:MAG: hydrogenase formation protein HypD [Nanobdellota archaeon]